MKKQYTYYESGKYYAVITLPNGYTYYSGPFNCKSTAYRYAKKMTAMHSHAAKIGMLYNTKGL